MDPQTISILLRPAWRIEITLPGDLTEKEAKQLIDEIKKCVRRPDETERN